MGKLEKIIRIIIAAVLLTVITLYWCFDYEWAHTTMYIMVGGICIYNLLKGSAAKK